MRAFWHIAARWTDTRVARLKRRRRRLLVEVVRLTMVAELRRRRSRGEP